MARKSKKFITIIVVIGCLAAVGGVKVIMGSSSGLTSTAGKSKIKGSDDAPLKITEYIDFECPACAAGSKYLSEMITEHPDLIRLQLKYFPLPMHPHGMTSAIYAECSAQQGKFWPMHDLLIERQANWKRLDKAQPAFNQMAKEIDLNIEKLSDCIQNGKVVRKIENDKSEGQTLNIRSTPTYFVNGKMFVGMRTLQQEIDRYLKENEN